MHLSKACGNFYEKISKWKFLNFFSFSAAVEMKRFLYLHFTCYRQDKFIDTFFLYISKLNIESRKYKVSILFPIYNYLRKMQKLVGQKVYCKSLIYSGPFIQANLSYGSNHAIIEMLFCHVLRTGVMCPELASRARSRITVSGKNVVVSMVQWKKRLTFQILMKKSQRTKPLK